MIRALSVALVALTAGNLASAEEPASEALAPEMQSHAQALFDEARALLRQSKFDEACSKFGESYGLDPALGTLINLATCQELQGKFATALASYTALLNQAEAANDTARRDIALARMEKLRPRISTLRIEVADAMRERPFTVELDGTRLSKSELLQPIPLDGGAHDIAVLQPKHVARREVLQLASSGEHRVYTVLPLEPEPSIVARPEAPAKRAVPSAPLVVSADALPASSSVSGVRTAGIIAFGIGASALAVGSYFAISAYTLHQESKREGCNADNVCTLEANATRDRALRAGNVATWTFVAGGVLASTGVVLYLVGQPRSHNRISLSVGPELRLQFTQAF